HGVDGVLQLEDLALHVHGDLPAEVAAGHRGGHLRDVPHLGGEVAGHEVHAVGERLPGPGDSRHLRLTTQAALGADLAGDAAHLAGEAVQLVHHRVDGLLQLEDLPAHVHGDLPRQV